jgi:hypothetical protein
MAGRKLRMVRYIDLTLRSKLKSQSLSSHSRMLPPCTKPAQLKSTSSGPISAAMRATAALSRTSSFAVVKPVRPSARASSASAASASSFMSVAQTCAPSRASASALSRPMPLPAAVTKVLLPWTRCVMVCFPRRMRIALIKEFFVSEI